MRYFIYSCLILFLTISCDDTSQSQLDSGHYRAVLFVQDNKELPFNFRIFESGHMEIYNGEEVINVESIKYDNDSIRINFPIYEGYIVGKFSDGKVTHTKFIKESLDRVVDMKISQGIEERFLDVKPTNQNISGVWEMLFKEDDNSTFIAKGIFEQNENIVTGTIRTTTGDHRYLEGVMDGDELKLSVFDGAHAFLYTAKVDENEMSNGAFYYGNHYKSTFIAKKNSSYELPHEDSLTVLNDGYDKIEFSFPDLNGDVISLSDEGYKGKVVITQIMGSWCPNCIDESKFYSDYKKFNSHPDLEFIALAFEYANTEEKALKSLRKLKKAFNIDYPILLAQYGSSDKKLAQEKLPMLNHVLSYPTTIFIDKVGNVRKIHTGYNGPATGDKFDSFKEEFDSFLKILLNE